MGKKRFHLNEFLSEANVTMQEAEDFFLPLLRKGTFEGKLELRCPRCGKDVGVYDRLSQIPEEIECETCGAQFSRSREYIEIILEVKNKFFRDQKRSPDFDRRNSNKERLVSSIE